MQTQSPIGIMSLNCQSINAKFDDFQLFIERSNKMGHLSVICLQETRTDNNCVYNCVISTSKL